MAPGCFTSMKRGRLLGQLKLCVRHPSGPHRDRASTTEPVQLLILRATPRTQSIDERAASSNSELPESMEFDKINPSTTTICTEQSQCDLCFRSLRGHSNPGQSYNITPCPAITKAARRISGPAPALIFAQDGQAGCTCKLASAVALPTSHARYSTNLPTPRARPVSAGSSEWRPAYFAGEVGRASQRALRCINRQPSGRRALPGPSEYRMSR